MGCVRDDLIIRRETPADADQVRAVTDAAFPHVEGTERSVESVLLEELRADGDVIETLTFVAELDGEVVGQVTCSRGSLAGAPSVGLGPIAVRPDLQQQGIGAGLMAAVIASADQMGEPVIVLLGDPGYYTHFGFGAASSHGIESPDPQWGEHFMAKPLRAWRASMAGAFRYAPAFERL
jgi:putative acetyltransferase